MKKTVLGIIAWIMSLSLVACGMGEDTLPPIENSDNVFSESLEVACADISLDINRIKNWEQIDDWANGERFRFTYERQSVVAYINFDDSVNSINIGGEDVYKKGYESYNVEDFIVDTDIAENLIPLAEDAVRLKLNYPSTADFSILDWAYGRNGTIYVLQSSVKAQNGFGVDSEIPFTVMFDLSTEGNAKCVYFALDGEVVTDQRPTVPERKKFETENMDEGNTEKWRLIDGQLGKYGVQDPQYPEYVDYYVPTGKYKVTNNAEISIVMIIDDKNNEEMSRITLSAGQSGETEVKTGYHIELTMYSDVTLEMLDE